jgi:palmitoyl-protein thioesterase
MVEPRGSEHFEFYVPGSDTEMLPLRESQIYIEDWIGLKALDEAGKLVFLGVEGDHLQVSTDWLISEIIQKYFV